MADHSRKKKKFMDRLGRKVVRLPSGQVFGLGIFGFLVFLSVTLIFVTNAFSKISAVIESRSPTAKTAAHPKPMDFSELVVKSTGLAYSAFFDLSLSKINFISNYVASKEAGERKWDYTFWELWVPNDFNFETARAKFSEKLASLGQAVRVEGSEIDSKTFRINIDIEGLNTHRVFLTRTAVETERGAEAMYVLPDVEENVPQKAYAGPPRVTVIIDDIGFRDLLEQQLLALEIPITFSILPFTANGQNFARRAVQKGREIMAHIPMEPLDEAKRPGRGALFVRMTPSELRQTATQCIDDVPGISGANNHMGSRFTSNEEKMAVILELIKNKNLYFIDSRTAGSSRAYEVARRMGVRTGVRNVFLDDNPEYPNILKQFDVLAGVAKRQGSAIAIGHPNDNTMRAIQVKLPELVRNGFRIVPPSEIVK